MRRLAALVALCVITASAALAAPPPVRLEPLPFQLPGVVEIVSRRDGTGNLYLVEQAGRIRIARNGQLLPTPFLDISTLVVSSGEQGLLGLAFDAPFAATGKFYVFYNRPLPGGATGSEIVVARYSWSASDPDRADPLSAQILLTIPHPGATNHNGGKLAVNREGHLLIGVGDGGGSGDPFGAAANPNDLRGKVLRIDPLNPADGKPYGIPFGNPYRSGGGLPEIFLSGLRNPWRFSFDRATGDLWVADVGQDDWEEVNFLQAFGGGADLGWSRWEGNHCFPAGASCTATPGMVFPVLEYGRAEGASVTGGYRYRGVAFPELRGFYVFGDFVSGRIWAAEPGASPGTWTKTQVGTHASLSTFGEDIAGELYAANVETGAIVRVAPVDSDADGISDAWETLHFGSATAADPAADADGDGAPNSTEYTEGLDPTARDNDIFTSNRLFALQQYRDFLGREGDATGVDSWVAMLERSWARRSISLLFLLSDEFQDVVAPASRLYLAYFRRAPDNAGLRFWVDQLRAGVSLPGMSNFFAGSDEFRDTYGSLGDEAFVDLVYQNVLGRAPDAAGRAFWSGQLASGMSRGEMMLGFSESTEFRQRVAYEVEVSMVYIGLLQRGPDPAGFDYWVGALEAGWLNLEFMINEFMKQPEYRARFLP